MTSPPNRSPDEASRGRSLAQRSVRILVVTLLCAVAASVLVLSAVLEIESGATAYMLGEGHWSRARIAAVQHLQLYALTGAATELEAARTALQVPLGDRAARLALDRSPPDLEAARRGFEAGLNAPDDIPRLIWLYRLFHDAPYFRSAVDVWRRAEGPLLEVDALADELERYWQTPTATRAEPYVPRLQALSARLQPLEREFSQTLQTGAGVLRVVAFWGSALVFAVIAGAAALVYSFMTRRIRNAESLFRAAFMQNTVGMAKLLPDGSVAAINERLRQLLGLDGATVEGACFERWFCTGEEGAAAPLQVDWRSAPAPFECRARGRDGQPMWCRLTVSPIQARRDEASRIFVMVEDISEARLLTDWLAHQATHDSLTGLINRREIERRLGVALDEVHAGTTTHTLCFLDLDQFKLVNDVSSHAAGDQLLNLVAVTLASQLSDPHWVGRLGGDEFALLLRDTALDAGRAHAERIARTLAATSLLWEGRHFSLTCSVGLVQMDAETPSVAWLLRAADTACHLAKEGGRNQVRVYAESDQEIARRHDEMAWANRVRAAIAEGRLRFYAQRIEPLRPQRAAGLQYEVLVRMIDVEGNLCLPGRFLPAVERFGQAAALDAMVIAGVLELLAAQPAHLERTELCHVNVSAQSAVSTRFRQQVLALLDASPVPARKLCFELTETASIAAFDEVKAFIAALRARGCQVALDDFGSGLSSFAYLKAFDVDILKIDGSFVRNMAKDVLDLAVVQSITEVAHTLGKRVIAEWAESDDVLRRLREIGVDAAQGYCLHQPCPLELLIEREDAGVRRAG